MRRPLAVRVVAAISGAAWVWSWYTVYLEIHRWKHVPLVPVQPETADPGHHHPAPARPSDQGALRLRGRRTAGFRGHRDRGSDPHARADPQDRGDLRSDPTPSMIASHVKWLALARFSYRSSS